MNALDQFRAKKKTLASVKRATAKVDKRVEAAYYRTCSGVQIPILKITEVFAVGRKAVENGADEAGLEKAITEFVATIRSN